MLNSEILQDAGVTDIRELTILTPGLLVTSTSNESVTTARIRGVGTVGDNPGLESSVGVVIDGVYRPRNGVGFGDLGQIERIEVLKGPQGTLFGKNTSAGVIQVFSAEPEFEFGADAEVTFGNYEKLGLSTSVTGPLIEDTLAARFFVTRQSREGFIDVETNGGPRGEDTDQNQDYASFRGQLLYTPNDNVDVRFIADYTERREDCCLGVTIPSPNPATQPLINSLSSGTGIQSGDDPFARVANANRDTNSIIEDAGIQMNVDWDLGFADFASVTALRTWETTNAQDTDFTGADIWYRDADGAQGRQFDYFTQEFRLNGFNEIGGVGVNWLVGLFYANEELVTDESLSYGEDYYNFFAAGLLGNAPAGFGLVEGTIYQPGFATFDKHEQDSDSIAIFTNNTFVLTDAFEVTAGLRLTSDTKDLTSTYQTFGGSCDQAIALQGPIIGALGAATAGAIIGNLCLPWQNQAFDRAGPIEQSLDEEEWTGTLKAQYRWNPQVMTYVSYARGYKSGGFNHDREQEFGLTATGLAATVDPDTTFPGEFVDSYELGAKMTLLDGDLLLNATAFYQEYENFQLNTFLGTNFIVTSIPGVESTGFEVDGIWNTQIDGLTVQGGLAYTDTTYVDFEPVSDALGLLPGQTISFAPEWTLSGSVAYETMLTPEYRMRASLNGRWTDDYGTASDQLPPKIQEAFAIFNGRLAFSTEDDRYTFELWGQNLFDEEYIQVGFNGPLQGGSGVSATPPIYDPARDTISYMAFLGAPRTWGATLRWQF